MDLTCPDCYKNSLHYFYLKWSEKQGGGRIWCSSCLSFIHASCRVPGWWQNIEGVPADCLEHQPEWLENNLKEWEPKLLKIVSSITCTEF